MYHAVVNLTDDPNMMSTSPKRFEEQMAYLRRRNLRGVSMRELCRGVSMGSAKRLIGLTFDDGYKDFLHTALPVLERLGFSATVFVVVGMLGKENDWEHAHDPRPQLKLLGSEEVREVSERGTEVGSHGMSHTNLLGLGPELLNQEVNDSRLMLSEVLGEEVEGFCYPYGDLDGAALQAVRGAGYSYACGWKTRVEQSAYDLPRIPISERDHFIRFAAKLKIYSRYSRITRGFR